MSTRPARFTAMLQSGHKGAAVECPFDPGARWDLVSANLAPGRRGLPVRAWLAGVAFESAVVMRSRRHWLLVGDAVMREAGVEAGDRVAVRLAPRAPAQPTPPVPAARKAAARKASRNAAPAPESFDALAFVREHGIVLVSGTGPMPRLCDAVAGERVRGSWWAHPRAKAIFDALQGACASPEVLACKLVGGKQTLVHRRLWPALVRCAGGIAAGRLDAVRQEHTRGGAHRNVVTPFPAWVPATVAREARSLDEPAARAELGNALA